MIHAFKAQLYVYSGAKYSPSFFPYAPALDLCNMFTTQHLLLRPAPLLSIMFFLLLQSAHSITATFQVGNSPSLQLTEGFNVSVEQLTDQQRAVRGYGDGTFYPLLSSPGFNSTDPQESSGFSFGFFSSDPGFSNNIFLAVCGGLSGNYSRTVGASSSSGSGVTITVGQNVQAQPSVQSVANGNSYAVRVWTANLKKPLHSVNSSLVVSRGTSAGNVLQLKDQNGAVVWSVDDVGSMEMKDSGSLVIYDTGKRQIWESLKQPRDTLVQNQKLGVGTELRSNDSSYLARVIKGQLVVYLNKPTFIEHPSPYMVIPLNNSESVLELILRVIHCEPQKQAYTMVAGNQSTNGLGRCPSQDVSQYSFLELGIDGRLSISVVITTQNPPSFFIIRELVQNNSVDWGQCAVPMACGPLGVCTPNATSPCGCPHDPSQEGKNLFTFLDTNNYGKGCTPVTHRLDCVRGDEHISTTTYLQLNDTTSIFLLSGQIFSSTSTKGVDTCKKQCSSNCLCTGFFVEAANTSFTCFFMTDGISILNVTSQKSTMIEASRSYDTYLKLNNSSSALAPTDSGTSASNGSTIAIAIVASFLACLLIVGLVVYLFLARRQRKAQANARQAEENQLRDILPLLPSRLSYQDLHKATGGFNKLLGAGGYASVYEGVLLDGRKIAVKELESGILKGHQSKQFLAEVATVGRTSHHNIVCLVGFCWEVSHRLLVYEYMERGSLDRWLFANGETSPLLDWQTRYNVALGMARGLTYLHEECPQPILHFDIKPQNILLDDAYVAKLADFGLSKIMQRGVSEVVTEVRGTPGYIAPEWLSHGAVTKKCDIYSMGMVMLEIVGGRKNVDLTLLSSVGNEWYFPSWAAKRCERGFMLEIVDKRIAQDYDKDQACRLINTAFWCIQENASMRPYAPTVLQWLGGNTPVKPPPFSAIANDQSSIEANCRSFSHENEGGMARLLE